MNTQERQVIDGLFDKLREAERQGGPIEPDAEAHIRARVDRQPGAPYLMAQTIVAQEQALGSAQTRIADLEGELSRRPAGGGGFLAGLFGGGGNPPAPAATQGTVRPAGPESRLAGQGLAQAQPGRGGGFLAGAAQTAMGVAGGLFLGNMLGNAFGGDRAEAAAPADSQIAAADDDPGFGGDMGGDDI